MGRLVGLEVEVQDHQRPAVAALLLSARSISGRTRSKKDPTRASARCRPAWHRVRPPIVPARLPGPRTRPRPVRWRRPTSGPRARDRDGPPTALSRVAVVGVQPDLRSRLQPIGCGRRDRRFDCRDENGPRRARRRPETRAEHAVTVPRRSMSHPRTGTISAEERADRLLEDRGRLIDGRHVAARNSTNIFAPRAAS